jgi:hypothetical protein
MRLGTEDALKAALQAMGLSGRLNTAFIERVNLTVRHGVAALARRTWATAQQSPQLLAHLECGVRTITLCVPMHRYEWRSCNHESEVASSFRNTIGNAPQPWPPAEPIADGRRAKCSCALCQRLPLERYQSQMEVAVSCCGEMGEDIRSRARGAASRWEEKACLDCLITKNQSEMGLERTGRIIHHIQ